MAAAPSNSAPSSAPVEPRPQSALEQELGKSNDRSKQATGRGSLALRVVLFALACVFAVAGVMGFMDASNEQATSRMATMGAVQEVPVRHACLLLSYDESDANTSLEREGVLDVFARSSVSADVFYLDARTFGGDAAAEGRLAAGITSKAIAAGGYDAVVTAGDEALAFVMEHQDLFAGIPTAFFAVDDETLAAGAQGAGVATGFVEAGAAELVVQAAAELCAGAATATVLVDGSTEAAGQLAQLAEDGSAAPGVQREVWDVSQMTREELAGRLAALPPGDFVVLLAANHDLLGGVYTPSVTAHFVSESSSAPVFAAAGGVGEGVCGAGFYDRQAEGANAATLAVDLLNGVKTAEKQIEQVAPECLVFDAAALRENGLDPDATPNDSAIVNEPAFSWRALRPFLQPALLLLVAIACIAGFGIIGFRRSMRSHRAIKESRDDLRYRLYHDLLTELPNRHALEQLLGDAQAASGVGSVVQIDISDFTDINDAYGHSFGDEVIRVVSERLRGVSALMLARFGGDEFTLVFDRPLREGDETLRQLMQAFDEPIVLGDTTIDLAVSMGVVNRADGMSGEDLIACSDLATRDAKANSAHGPVFYNDEMRRSMERKLEITAHLKRAIAQESIEVLWQPQVDTDTLQVYGYEALCRLKGNAYYPNDFIPVAEMSGLVSPLDRIVTKKVIEQLGAWRKSGLRPGVASINFSAAQLRDKGYCDFLAEQLAANDVPAELLKVEITESMILDNEEDATELFSRLRAMGITLALDDFGTGYSSLSRMAKRPVDFVKLDKSLVDTFMAPGKEGFIHDITQLVHGLDKRIVVEGVETLEQYEICQALGCDLIQGYFFSRPVGADEAIALDPVAVLRDARAVAARAGGAGTCGAAGGLVDAIDDEQGGRDVLGPGANGVADAEKLYHAADDGERNATRNQGGVIEGDGADDYDESGGKARNSDWQKYVRDERGRWMKNGM